MYSKIGPKVEFEQFQGGIGGFSLTFTVWPNNCLWNHVVPNSFVCATNTGSNSCGADETPTDHQQHYAARKHLSY